MNNDLISREALKDKAETVTLWNGDVRRFVSYETIDNAPPIEYTFEEAFQKTVCEKRMYCPSRPRPHSKWIITGEEQGALGIIYKKRKCSKCGWEHGLVIPDNFCPNCGAKMYGQEAEDETN